VADSASLRVARGLAYVCGHLDELRELLGDDGSDPDRPLARLIAALRAPEPEEIAARLDAVDAAVQEAGDMMGVYGPGPARGPAGLDALDALQIVYRCPLKRCAGRPANVFAGARPVCTVSPERLPLVRERL
jgi:hypothetical protein